MNKGSYFDEDTDELSESASDSRSVSSSRSSSSDLSAVSHWSRDRSRQRLKVPPSLQDAKWISYDVKEHPRDLNRKPKKKVELPLKNRDMKFTSPSTHIFFSQEQRRVVKETYQLKTQAINSVVSSLWRQAKERSPVLNYYRRIFQLNYYSKELDVSDFEENEEQKGACSQSKRKNRKSKAPKKFQNVDSTTARPNDKKALIVREHSALLGILAILLQYKDPSAEHIELLRFDLKILEITTFYEFAKLLLRVQSIARKLYGNDADENHEKSGKQISQGIYRCLGGWNQKVFWDFLRQSRDIISPILNSQHNVDVNNTSDNNGSDRGDLAQLEQLVESQFAEQRLCEEKACQQQQQAADQKRSDKKKESQSKLVGQKRQQCDLQEQKLQQALCTKIAAIQKLPLVDTQIIEWKDVSQVKAKKTSTLINVIDLYEKGLRKWNATQIHMSDYLSTALETIKFLIDRDFELDIADELIQQILLKIRKRTIFRISADEVINNRLACQTIKETASNTIAIPVVPQQNKRQLKEEEKSSNNSSKEQVQQSIRIWKFIEQIKRDEMDEVWQIYMTKNGLNSKCSGQSKQDRSEFSEVMSQFKQQHQHQHHQQQKQQQQQQQQIIKQVTKAQNAHGDNSDNDESDSNEDSGNSK